MGTIIPNKINLHLSFVEIPKIERAETSQATNLHHFLDKRAKSFIISYKRYRIFWCVSHVIAYETCDFLVLAAIFLKFTLFFWFCIYDKLEKTEDIKLLEYLA